MPNQDITTAVEAQSSIKCSQNEMFTFSVTRSSLVEVVNVLCQYLEREGCSKQALIAGEDASFIWQETFTIFVDLVPLRIEMQAKPKGDEICVTVSDLSLSDVIRCKRMFNALLKFVQGAGLTTTCKHQLSLGFRLLDDDFHIMDYDLSSEDEVLSSTEQVAIEVFGIDACRYDFHEEALRAISSWSSSNMERHQSLAGGVTESSASISSLLHMESLIETYPCWLKLCETW
jgi:hypothetical protein